MRDLIVAAVIFGMLPWALARAHIGVYLWYWLGMMNPHRLAYGFAATLPFAMIIAITTLIALFLSKDRKPIPWNMGLVLMLLLFAYTTLTSFYAWAPIAAWDYWGTVGKIFVMTLVMAMLIHGRQKIQILLLVVALSIGIFGLKGGILAVITGGSHRVWGPGEGTFISDNNFMGLAMVMVLPLLILLARNQNRKWFRIGLQATAFFTVVAIIFTYSRGALLGLLVVLPLIFLRSKRKFWVILLIVPLLLIGKEFMPASYFERAGTIETYEADESAMQRIRSWMVAWNIAVDQPLLGAGYNFEASGNKERWFSYVPPEYLSYGTKVFVAHSSYFQVLGQHGFVGFAIYVLLIFYVLFRLQRIKTTLRTVEGKVWIADVASAIQIAVIGYMVSGAFLNAAYFDLLYLYVGLTAVLQREMKAVDPIMSETAGQFSNPSSRTKSGQWAPGPG